MKFWELVFICLIGPCGDFPPDAVRAASIAYETSAACDAAAKALQDTTKPRRWVWGCIEGMPRGLK